MRILIFILLSLSAYSQTRDSIVYDSSYKQVCYDSLIINADTFKVNIPPSTVTLRGVYSHPDYLTLGSASSENRFLQWCVREGCNMINMYSRSSLYSETGRTQLAAFVKKAKEQYGIILITVDARLTNSKELPGWKAYLSKYNNTIFSIEPLTEFEPYVKNDAGVYDYPGFFSLIQTMGELCKSYNIKLNFYEGWIGNHYSNPQGAVDSLVKYCDRVFISNYISVTDYNSTDPSYGAWDSRMDKRCNMIAIADKRQGKTTELIEIVSLEPTMLLSLYSCPVTTVNKCHSFFGSRYDKAVSEYEKSSTDIIKYTDLKGRTIFYIKYALQAHPY